MSGHFKNWLLATSVFTSLAANQAMAAGGNMAAVEEVVVTGTQIRGVAPIGSTMIEVPLDAPNAATGTIQDVLRELPQISALGSDDSHNAAVQGAQQNIIKGTSLNLRGIGPSGSMLLVNGHRVPINGAVGSFYDPTIISNDAIQRVEVIADGASAIYGSDAIAGVVNVILKKDYEGVRLNVGHGFADGFTQDQMSVTAGHNWDGGSLTATVSSNYRGGLKGADRNYFTQNETVLGGHDYRSQNNAPGNFTIGGVTYGLPNTDGTALTPIQIAAGKTVNLFDASKAGQIFPSQQRYNATLEFTQKVTDWLDVSLDYFFANRKYTALGVPTSNITVTSANPFFVSPVAGQTSGTVNYNFLNDVGLVRTTAGTSEQQGNLNFSVKLPSDWVGDFTAGYGTENEGSNGSQLFNSNATVFTALLNNSNRFVALNVFGNGTANNPATLKSLFIGNNYYLDGNRLANFDARFNGSLFSLWAGDVKLAVGAGFRHEWQLNEKGDNNTPTSVYALNRNLHQGRQIFTGFGEAAIPLVAPDGAIPLIQKLDLSVAVRHEEYSDVGSTTNPKIGFDWKPFDDLMVHGSYGTSFHAPEPYQLSPITVAAQPAFQPDPTVAGGRSFAITTTGGNAALTPETATTYSLGADYKSSWLPGLSSSLNYFDIDYTNQISQVGGGTTTILSQPAIYSAFFTRSPTLAQVLAVINATPNAQSQNTGTNPSTVTVLIDGRSNNLGVSLVKGLDFTARYGFDAELGRFDLSETGTYYLSYRNSITPTAPLVGNIGNINYPTRYRSVTRLSWTNGDWQVDGYLNFTPSYNNNLVASAAQVGSATTVDTRIGYAFANESGVFQDLTLSLGVQNLFDVNPPFVDNPLGYAYDPQNTSAYGRVFSLDLIKKVW